MLFTQYLIFTMKDKSFFGCHLYLVIRGVREYHACIFKYFIINGKSKNTRVYCWLLNPHGKTPCLLLENWDIGCVKFLQLTMFSEMRVVFHSMQSLMTGLLSFKFIYLRFIYSVLCTYFCSFLLRCNISFCRYTTIYLFQCQWTT